jgi:hypothetical protein
MRTLIATICTVAAVALGGCGSDSGGTTNPQSTSPVGTWNLVTANGAPLPFAFQSKGVKYEIMSDQYVFLPDGSFTETYLQRDTDGTIVGLENLTDEGTWKVTGTVFVITYGDNGAQATGTFSGDTVTLTQLGASMVYHRQ